MSILHYSKVKGQIKGTPCDTPITTGLKFYYVIADPKIGE